MKFNIIVIIINKNINIFISIKILIFLFISIKKALKKDFKYGLLGFNFLGVVRVTSA